jgi:hypothetical protein
MATKMLPGSPGVEGSRRTCTVDIDGPASYPTGGVAITAAQFGLKIIEAVETGVSDNAGHTIAPRFSIKGPSKDAKLVWVVVGTGVEVANAVNLSARFTRIRVIGY